MPGIFGALSNRGVESISAPARFPGPENPDDKLFSVSPPGLELGVYLSAGRPAADGVFVTKDGTALVCVCDAEVTNGDEIAATLRSLRIPFDTTGSAELIARLYATLGLAALAALRGGFSAAMWNGRELCLAVDRSGMKRMSYALGASGSISFGSRVAAAADASISPIAVYQYLTLGFIPSPQSIYSGVQKLPPGCVAIWKEGGVSVQRYSEIKYPEDLSGSTSGLGVRLKDQLQTAVQSTAEGVADLSTGCYLSGGTDSSTVLGLCKGALGTAPPAFTIGFSDEQFDEMYYARIAATHFGAPLYEHVVTADDGWRILPALVRAFDEPFGNSSAVGGYACAELAAAHNVRVMFAGDGGDELFGGNERYRKERIYSWLHHIPKFVLNNGAADALWKLLPEASAAVRFRKIAFRASVPNPERFYLEDCLSADLSDSLISPDLMAAVPEEQKPLQVMKRLFSEVAAKDELNRLLFLDLKFTIAENDLVKVRQTAAANGLRVRFPMLDPMLIDFSGRIPANLKVKGLNLRYLFKESLKDFLPHEIIHKTKHGFGVPVSLWFREDSRFRGLLLDVLGDRRVQERGYYRADVLQRIVQEHERGVFDWGSLLWSILMFELWHQERTVSQPISEPAPITLSESH
jgi:asparagine synthase (glutamine-hydrolysing)